MSIATSVMRKSSGSSATALQDLAHLEGALGLVGAAGIRRLHVLELRSGLWPARAGAQPRVERVAQGAHQIAALVAADHPGSSQDARERLLHEILGILAGSAQRPGGAVESVEMLTERLRVEAAHHLCMLRGSGRPGSF